MYETLPFLLSSRLSLTSPLFSPAFWPRGRPTVVPFIQVLKTRVCQELGWSRLQTPWCGVTLPAWVGQRSPVLEKQIKHQCRKKTFSKSEYRRSKVLGAAFENGCFCLFPTYRRLFFYNQKSLIDTHFAPVPLCFYNSAEFYLHQVVSGNPASPELQFCDSKCIISGKMWKVKEVILNNSDHAFIHHRALLDVQKQWKAGLTSEAAKIPSTAPAPLKPNINGTLL